jgi:rhomboid protease GluP
VEFRWRKSPCWLRSTVMSPHASVDPLAEHQLENLIAVGTYPTYAAGAEHGLVVLAMGRPYWLVPAEDRFALLVEATADSAVREQLARFDRESVGWPPPPVDLVAGASPVDLLTPLMWATLVLAAFRVQLLWPQAVGIGALDAAALFERHEVWRVATALFLHGDVGHLVSNLASGVFVFAAVTSAMGRARGWALLALAALAGNAITAWARYPAPYISIGASTAIFAGLGLLTGRALRLAARVTAWQRWRAMFVPLAAGGTVLALYGAGDVQVDLGAHLCGFLAGLGLGVVATRTMPSQSRRSSNDAARFSG